LDRAADNHYPTSSLADIKARDVSSIAAEDCVLYLAGPQNASLRVPATTASTSKSARRNLVDPAGTPVETCLQSRGLELDVTGDVLRWHPRLRAMIALFRNIVASEPQAVSRTFLDPEARKIERKFLGPVGGAAIKLDADEDVLCGLHIGEGVETCMAARMIGLRPSWALRSAGAIAGFPVLSGVG
jgi:hypothetical protein